MTSTSFNSGWSYRQPLGPFAALQGRSFESTAVTLPHDALREAQRRADVPGKGATAYFPNGAYSYLKSFDAPADWADKAVRLEFQGAYRHAMVFVNDELAGNRADGYARFFVDIKPYLRVGGTNEVRVELRSGLDSRWYSGCGLHRDVVLHVDGLVHIAPDGVRVRTIDVDTELAIIEVATTVSNNSPSTVTVEVTSAAQDESGTAVDSDRTPLTLAPAETAVARQRLYLDHPRLWSVDSPSLYDIATTLGGDDTDVTDEVETAFGIRTIQVDSRRGLRINGEPVLLRGACIHSDNGPLGSAAIGRAEERRVELLKAAGFNAIRSAHNPLSPAILDACDRLGLLVMDEAFDMWTRFKSLNDYALDFPQWWAADLESLVCKDFNHPSVILYSLGNEIVETGTPHGARLARRMAEHVRGLDETRLITNGVNAALAVMDEAATLAQGGLNEALADMAGGMNALGASPSADRRTAESSSVLDILGLNYAEDRYGPDHQKFPHRVIVGSETFPTLIGKLWPMVRDNPHVIGDFTWTGWDYLGEVGIGATTYAEDSGSQAAFEREFPYLTAQCGDIDITGHRRPVSYYREIVFGLRTEPYIAVHRPEHHDHTIAMRTPWAWSDSISSWTWPGFEHKPVTVEVYGEADEVALLLNGDEVARGTVGAARPLLAELETTYAAGELTAIAYRDGVECGRTSLRTAGDPTLAVEVDRAVIRADDSDLAYLAIELRDSDGVLNTAADRAVSVAVSGPAILAGMCSANPSTTVRFADSTWRMFDGRALAVVRPTAAGEIIVRVAADGLDPVTVQLRAE